jgi:very-short-patch-repair endonuclease
VSDDIDWPGDDVEPREPDEDEFWRMMEAELKTELREKLGLQKSADWAWYCFGEWEDHAPADFPFAIRTVEPPAPVPETTQSGVPLKRRGRREQHLLTPIEAMFYDALAETDLMFFTQPSIQQASQEYRIDFVVFYGGRAVVVELWGHDFHKTPEQQDHDTNRERWLQSRGLSVVRFTGRQINRDVQGCVNELRDILRQKRARP